jgi:hypothetical protein
MGGHPGGCLQLACYCIVWALSSQCQVAGAFLGGAYDCGQPTVGGATIGGPSLFGDYRAHQRVDEGDTAGVDQHARLNAGLQVSMRGGWISGCGTDHGQYGLRGKRAD